MNCIAALQTLRTFLSSERCLVIWACIFCLFLCSIFLTANVRLHRNLFYLMVIPPFFFLVQASFMASLFRSPLFLASLAYLSYLWLSLLWAPETEPYTLYNEARTLVLMLIFLAITAWYAYRMDNFSLLLSKCLTYVVGTTAVISLYWFYSTHSFASWGDYDSRAVAIGLFTYPLDSAVAYGFVAVFLIFSQFVSRRDDVSFSWITVFFLTFILFFICMTQTRGVIMSIAMIVVLGMALQRSRQLALILALLGVVTTGIVLLTLYHPGGMIGYERSFSVRWEIWQAALDVAKERIWFGYGLNEHQKLLLTRHPGYMDLGYQGVTHSIYLENLIFGGLAGTILLFLLLSMALRRAYQAFAQSGNFFLLAILLFPMLSGMSTGFLNLSKIAPEWLQFWLPIGLIIGNDIQRKNPSPAGDSQPAYSRRDARGTA